MKRMLFVLFVFTAFFAATASAQVNTGSLSGTVKDSSGSSVIGATITAASTATGTEYTGTSGDIGQYTIQSLNPGIYKITIASPNFKTFQTTVEIVVGTASTVNAALEVGASTTTVEVIASYGTEVNTQTQELSQLVDSEQLAVLPSLNRNPYDFVVLSGNVSSGDNTNNSMTSGQSLSNRGVGYAINGQREAGTEILLDGVENVSVFGVAIGQIIPADSIQEFSIITNNFGAEFGRASGGVVNVDTKSGTNNIHGSAFEYNRVSALTANTFANDAQNALAGSDVAPKGIYVRNDFGYNVGGPIIKNKLFASFFEEFVRVRSASSQVADVFDPAFISLLPANDQAYFAKFGTGAAPSSGSPVTAGELEAKGAFGTGGLPLINGTTPLPAATPVFDTVHFSAPFNAGGGTPQNTYNLLGRVDYNLGSKTQMFFRFARYSENDFNGSAGYSPYPQYNVGDTNFDNSGLFSINHSFSSNLLSNSKVSFTRFNTANSFNAALTNTPNLYLQNGNVGQSHDPVTGDLIQLPGLQNSTDGNGGLPFGGPQNTLQLGEDLAWTKGRHTMRFGGEFTYIQLNVAYGAYQQAVEALGTGLSNSLLALVNAGGIKDGTGAFASPIVEFDARVNGGVLPCVRDTFGNLIVTPACTVTPPLAQASPARSYRYKDWAVYAQDSFKINRKLTINYGLRYEHYGVQHNDIQTLDSNFYQGKCPFPCNIETGNVAISPLSYVGQSWAPRWGTPAPRVGFAYDVFGDGKTSIRGGAGISYERNFGNVTYNQSFNPPASAVVTAACGANGSGVVTNCTNFVTNNDLGPLGLSTTAPSGLPPVELRDNQNNINVAQTQFWSLAVERQLAPSTILAVSYSGAHSVHLYDLANLNLIGSAQAWAGQPLVTGANCPYSDQVVSGQNDCFTRLNQQYSNINVRGSNGVSTYNALNVKLQTVDFRHTGLSLVANYTWAHALDDLSDTFSGSETQASLGYTNPLHPQLDYGNSDYDIRHRLVLSPIWQTPWFKGNRGFLGQALGGWNISGIYTARTGTPFSYYDLSYVLNGYVIPRLTPATPITQYHVGTPVQVPGQANQYTALAIPASGVDGTPFNTTLNLNDFGPFPANMIPRNAFRGPGAWNLDAAVQKDFKLTERFGLVFRAEGFDVLNHHNFYVNATNNYGFGAATQIIEEKGGLGTVATGGNNDERRFMQFSLRLTF
jgi:Carboxypeptidase regulatory-like domain/TonB dependent receptor